ncbi:MAG: DUF3160 domain-containing protein [Ignavibacteriales bacterium]|nr:MAG: DUF3160 domain-containing protein [Ignavibacteriales bacterium]
MKYKWLVLFLFFLSSEYLFPQSNFNIQAYQQFVNSHQNLETQQLLQMHPAGMFNDNIGVNFSSALYFDTIDIKYSLTDYEKSLIQNHGFMVSERLSQNSFGQILLDIHHNDLPVFVSTDAMLYAFHVSYDRILRDVELGLLIEKVTALINTLRSSMPQLAAQYNTQPELNQMLRDVDIYLTVAAKLIGQATSPFYADNSARINELFNKVMAAEGFSVDTIFTSTCRSHDWSQFKPRGHYDSDMHPQLRKYFRTMMWLGRMEIYLIAPPLGDPFCQPQTFEDIQRQIIDAVLISELFDVANAIPAYTEIENVIRFFVGDQDNVTLDNLFYLKSAVNISSCSQLLDSVTLGLFQDSLSQQSFAYQKIVSQILAGTWSANDSIVPASAFLLFGQRYVDDSYVTGSVVYDRIKYNGQNVCRLFPSTLDPMFALGNNAAAQLLTPELNAYHYSTNLATLRYLFDLYLPEYWNATFYRQWLNAIRTLNPPDDRNNLPSFMQTAAFWQQKLNTQLASWTELRHDNLLYAKQSYTGVPVCSYPYSYVEPFPELYNVLIDIGTSGHTYFQTLNIDPQIQTGIIQYFSDLISISDTLKQISIKELNDTPLTNEEIIFLKDMLFESQTYTGVEYDGWYPKLLYQDQAYQYEGLLGRDNIVADIHTTPSDCEMNMIGWVKHVGTGPVDMGVFIAQLPGGEDCAFVGPMLSYRDYTTTNFLRLTDEEWKNQYLFSSLRPDWVNIYLADSTGNSRGPGQVLITDVDENDQPIIPNDHILISNYPNPFNPSTIIAFTIPASLTNSNVKLDLFDVQGQLVKTLISGRLASGNYIVRWEGENASGSQVSTGVYIYNLTVGERIVSGKMMLLK